MIKRCHQCGRAYEPSQDWLFSLFCSRECADAHYQKAGSARREMELIVCRGCGQGFFASPIKDRRTRFCSETCRAAWWKAERRRKTTERKIRHNAQMDFGF